MVYLRFRDLPLDFPFFSRFFTRYPRAAASGFSKEDCWAAVSAKGDFSEGTALDPPNIFKAEFSAGADGASQAGRLNNFLTAGRRITDERKNQSITCYELLDHQTEPNALQQSSLSQFLKTRNILTNTIYEGEQVRRDPVTENSLEKEKPLGD